MFQRMDLRWYPAKRMLVPRGGIVESNIFKRLPFPNLLKAHTELYRLFREIPNLGIRNPAVLADFSLGLRRGLPWNRTDSVEMGHLRKLPTWSLRRYIVLLGRHRKARSQR